MKRIFAVIFMLLLAVITVTPCFAAGEFEVSNPEYYNRPELRGTTINVFNWGLYISDTDDGEGMIDVNKEFEKLTGIKVNYTTFASNEDMYAKLKSGGTSYDVIIPSDYMIQKLVSEDMVKKIDYKSLPNFKNIAEEYTSMYFDPNNEYCVAYSVGFVGLIYNTSVVEEAPTSWSALWDERYAGKILMFDNYRDAFAVAQQLLGISINTTDEAELRNAADKLLSQKPLLQSYVMDETYNKMETGEAALAPYYAGDFVCMQEVNPDLEFVYPEEGVNIFVDAACIPNSSQNTDAAELYINFLLEPKVALANALCIGYATPNEAVLELEEYADMAENKYLYPDEKPKSEYFHSLSTETLDVMSDLWNEVKTSGENIMSVYIGLSATAVLVVVFYIAQKIKKKKRDIY